LEKEKQGNCSPMVTNSPSAVRAVLFDRDGTLIVDVPYNADPRLVRPMPSARLAVAACRERGLRVGVITNQSAIGRGLVSSAQVGAVNQRVDALFGGFDVWRVCPHDPQEPCDCRKPKPGMVLSAAEELGLEPAEIAVIGDIGADVEAAEAAGALGVLVPTPVTRRSEVRASALVAPTVHGAIALLERVAGGAA
jgi:D-glycero-D-manno-heptose 1,7-bisphosphate phosphatase